MSGADLVALVCCDLGAIVRGRSVLLSELDDHLPAGVSWVPANHSLTPLGPVAEPNPFGSTGDLRLLPDPLTHIRVGPEFGPAGASAGAAAGTGTVAGAGAGASALELLLCDIVETDGRPWACCPRHFLRETLATIDRELGARVISSFEHEFQLIPPGGLGSPTVPAPTVPAPTVPAPTVPAVTALPFSLAAMREAEPFAGEVMGALIEAGVAPERFLSEYSPGQFEIPVAVSEGLESADRSIIFREVVREIARRHGLHASFSPLLGLDDAGNGVHIHFNLLDASGRSLLYDPSRPSSLSELGGRFAAGILRHARALTAFTAPSPVSGARLQPHRWSAGAVCLAQQNREALLRITPIVELGGADPASQLHLEYRGADATANPHLALATLLLAGLEGVLAELPTPPILDRDPAELSEEAARPYRLGELPRTLEEALDALAADDSARRWLNPLLLDAHLAVKRSEAKATTGWEPAEKLRRYAEIY